MTKAIYPGTFDPITYGHLDVIERAAKIFDEVIVAIMINPRKKCSFTVQERHLMIEKCVNKFPNVKVVESDDLTVRLANELGCKILIRGIRAVADYEYELAQAASNMRLDDGIETLFLVSKPEYSFLSSSIAKEVALFDGDITKFVPREIADDILNKFKNNQK